MKTVKTNHLIARAHDAIDEFERESLHEHANRVSTWLEANEQRIIELVERLFDIALEHGSEAIQLLPQAHGVLGYVTLEGMKFAFNKRDGVYHPEMHPVTDCGRCGEELIAFRTQIASLRNLGEWLKDPVSHPDHEAAYEYGRHWCPKDLDDDGHVRPEMLPAREQAEQVPLQPEPSNLEVGIYDMLVELIDERIMLKTGAV